MTSNAAYTVITFIICIPPIIDNTRAEKNYTYKTSILYTILLWQDALIH